MRLQAGGDDYPGKHTMPGIYRYLHVVSSHTRVPQTVECVPPAATAHLQTHAMFRSWPGSGHPHRCSPVRTSAFVRTAPAMSSVTLGRTGSKVYARARPQLFKRTMPDRVAAQRCDVCALVSAFSVVSLTHCAMHYTAILQLIGGPSDPSVNFLGHTDPASKAWYRHLRQTHNNTKISSMQSNLANTHKHSNHARTSDAPGQHRHSNANGGDPQSTQHSAQHRRVVPHFYNDTPRNFRDQRQPVLPPGGPAMTASACGCNLLQTVKSAQMSTCSSNLHTCHGALPDLFSVLSKLLQL